ncbi:MAG: enoyl-CoA hydratase [Polaromonas sp.]|nr:enoyl-CoA hydratase [Polaromonas sp.]
MGNVTYTLDAHVATIVLSNEGRFNAMSLAMWQQLAALLGELKNNAAVRAVVLRGDGDRAFVSGADISEFGEQRNSPAGVAAYDRAVDEAQTALAGFPRPVIAAISGICYGGGLGLALACDIRYASKTAKFRMPAARLGLGYALKGVKRMVDVLGVANASELFYTARVCDAQDALKIGLVSSVQDDCFLHAAETAAQMSANAPLTIAAAKLAFLTVLAGSSDTDAEKVALAVKTCFESQDYTEGRQAFAEKRPARFVGR